LINTFLTVNKKLTIVLLYLLLARSKEKRPYMRSGKVYMDDRLTSYLGKFHMVIYLQWVMEE